MMNLASLKFSQLPGLEDEEEADGGQQAGVADRKPSAMSEPTVAGDEDDLVLQLVVGGSWRAPC